MRALRQCLSAVTLPERRTRIHDLGRGTHRQRITYLLMTWLRPSTCSDARSKGGLCPRLVFLIGAAHDDLERIIGQWTLQRLRLLPGRAHPDIPFLLGREDHRRRLRMNRRNNHVRRGREKAVDQVRAGDRLRLGAAVL